MTNILIELIPFIGVNVKQVITSKMLADWGFNCNKINTFHYIFGDNSTLEEIVDDLKDIDPELQLEIFDKI